LRSGFASHEKSKFSHAFGTFSRLWFRSLVALVLAIELFLVEFLLTALTLLLEALHDVDGATYMAVIIPRIESITSSGIEARGLILAAKGIRCAGQRLCMSETRSGP
jgi:hypothetical protein